MTDVDVAKLKRLRSSVSSVLAGSGEKQSRGLPSAYEQLRAQILTAVPQGLVSELEQICPQIGSSSGRGDVIAMTMQGEQVRIYLFTLKGWLDAVIDS